MANPIEEFLLVKKANPFQQVLQGPMAKRMLQAGTTGLAVGGASAGVAGIVSGAQALFNAATKKRDFDRMMLANPHLQPLHSQDPDGFNRMFTSIRAMNPEFTREPMVAGAYMFQAMEQPVESRGMLAVRARGEVREMKPGPLSRAAYEGFQKGFSPDGHKGARAPRGGHNDEAAAYTE